MHDAPTLILLPGLDGRGLFFKKLCSALHDDISTVTLPYPDTPLGYEELADYVETKCDLSKPFVILGESFGGPLALTIAARGYEGLRGVILAATFTIPPLPSWAIKMLASSYYWTIRGFYASDIINFFLFNSQDMTGAKKTRDILLSQPDEVVLKRISEVGEAQFSNVLSSLSCPSLLLVAKHDRVLARNYPASLLRSTKKRKVFTFDAPHALFDVEAQTCADAISDFMYSLT